MKQTSHISARAVKGDIDRMRPPTKNLSVILGCYNAAGHLGANVVDLSNFLDTLGRSYELLMIEDDSQDDSLAILRHLENKMPNLAVLRNPRNMGKGFSIRNGILNSSGEYIVFSDSDMVYSKRNILTLVEKLDSGCPIVIGNRRLPESMYTVNNRLIKYVYRRHRSGLVFNIIVRKLFGLRTRDTQSGLKGFVRHAAVRIFDRLYTDGFLFDIEIFIRAKKLGIPIEEIPVHLTYHTDESTVKQLRQLWKVLPDLTRIKMLELSGAYDTLDTEEFVSPAETDGAQQGDNDQRNVVEYGEQEVDR